MTEPSKGPVPTEIKLHRKSRILAVSFADGQRFELPCEYLRVHSHAAEVTARRTPEHGKQGVNIDSIETQGSYAIRIAFDDGHDTGIYSWETLYDLGIHQQANWQQYLQRLAAAGLGRSADREDAPADTRERVLTILYFSYLANKMRKESEQVAPPAEVETVAQLLAWLRRVKGDRGYLFGEDSVRVTVNKQFSEPFTRLDPGDEIAIVPNSPNPPPAPKADRPVGEY